MACSPMNDILLMEEMNGLETLKDDGGNERTLHDGLRDNVGEGTPVEVLHDDPQFVLLLQQEGLHVVDNVLVSSVLHYLDLRDDQIAVGLLGQVHNLNGDRLVGHLVARSSHRPRGSVEGGGEREC